MKKLTFILCMVVASLCKAQYHYDTTSTSATGAIPDYETYVKNIETESTPGPVVSPAPKKEKKKIKFDSVINVTYTVLNVLQQVIGVAQVTTSK